LDGAAVNPDVVVTPEDGIGVVVTITGIVVTPNVGADVDGTETTRWVFTIGWVAT
jgi:hypothetical protein